MDEREVSCEKDPSMYCSNPSEHLMGKTVFLYELSFCPAAGPIGLLC